VSAGSPPARGAGPIAFERTKSVRFAHCDPAGIVFYPQYLVLCNEIVEDWFADEIGVDFRRLHHELRRGVPMVHLEVDFVAPSELGDTLDFRLVVAALGNASITLDVSASSGGDPRLRTAQKLVLMDLDTRRPVPIEPAWRDRMTRFLAAAD
jgi:4-hydroxybenzoyl-CoA thioesterase